MKIRPYRRDIELRGFFSLDKRNIDVGVVTCGFRIKSIEILLKIGILHNPLNRDYAFELLEDK